MLSAFFVLLKKVLKQCLNVLKYKIVVDKLKTICYNKNVEVIT